MNIRPSLALITLALSLSGCGGDDGTASIPADSYLLNRAVSNSQFEQYLKQGLKDSLHRTYGDAGTGGAPSGAGSSAPSTQSASDSSPVPTSGTNLIVQGVDEADRVKNDGQRLYVARVSQDYPPPPPVIDIHTIQSGPAASSLAGSVTLGETDEHIEALYLLPASGTQPALLAATGYAAASSQTPSGVAPLLPGDWINPWYWQAGHVKLWLAELSDPLNPLLTHTIDVEGYTIASRRIDDTLYLVTRHTPALEGLVLYPANKEEAARSEQRIDETALDELLPRITINGDIHPLVSAADCFMPHYVREGDYMPSLITITAVDLRDPAHFTSTCYGGQAEGIYATPQSIYLTLSEYAYQPVAVDISVMPVAAPSFVVEASTTSTVIHKFTLENGAAHYAGSGKVPGTLGGANPAFMMGERDDVLRIITTESPWQNPRHRLFSLALDAQKNELRIISQLPNDDRPAPLGKPGEMLHAARFIDDRAYLVTFQKTDPLYVIDIADPYQPFIAGELEVPGFSDYLHPIGDTLLLGVGKGAIPDSSGSFAWYQGVKVSLFDVSDANTMREIASVDVGERGSHTPLFYDHRALSHLSPTAAGEPHRFTLPIVVMEGDTTPGEPWDWAPWKHTGLYLFEVDEGANANLRLQGAIVSEQNDGETAYPSNYYANGDRAVIQGDAVHYVHDNDVLSADWSTVTP